MGTLGRKIGSKSAQYTRIEILKPDKIDDGYSSLRSSYSTVRANVPAYYSDPQDNDEESLQGSLIRSRTIAEFEVRYSFGKDIKPTWRVRDQFEDKLYEVVSSVVTVDRRRWIRFNAARVE